MFLIKLVPTNYLPRIKWCYLILWHVDYIASPHQSPIISLHEYSLAYTAEKLLKNPKTSNLRPVWKYSRRWWARRQRKRENNATRAHEETSTKPPPSRPETLTEWLRYYGLTTRRTSLISPRLRRRRIRDVIFHRVRANHYNYDRNE